MMCKMLVKLEYLVTHYNYYYGGEKHEKEYFTGSFGYNSICAAIGNSMGIGNLEKVDEWGLIKQEQQFAISIIDCDKTCVGTNKVISEILER